MKWLMGFVIGFVASFTLVTTLPYFINSAVQAGIKLGEVIESDKQ